VDFCLSSGKKTHISASYKDWSEKYWTLRTAWASLRGDRSSYPCVSQKRGVAMKLVETLKSRTGALKVSEVAKLFGVTPQHIYKMAASGRIPSFRISGSVRFDPDEVAAWLKEKQAPVAASRRVASTSVAA
jgi:excisionase family DNA binding protein